jgi:RNA polymerase sigma-70 factor (ECF subfamily)
VEEWVGRYGPELRRHLGRMTNNADDAEDILQQVWISAVEKPPDDGPGSNVRAWLYRVATNAALDSLARKRFCRRALQGVDPGATAGDLQPPDAGFAGLDEETRARVREQCAKLPTKQREAVWLRWAEGLDYPTIAQRLDSSTESARANVHHGMKKLRESLLDIWEEEVER